MISKIVTPFKYIWFLCLVLLACLFIGTQLPFQPGYQMRIVETGSMSPTIPTGSVAFVSPHSSYAVGDVITFKRVSDNEVVTHRIINASQNTGEFLYMVQGDANNAPDQKPVRPSEVIGSVWWSVPILGYILNFVRQPVGFAIVVGVPAVWIIVEQGRKLVLETRKVRNDAQKNTPV